MKSFCCWCGFFVCCCVGCLCSLVSILSFGSFSWFVLCGWVVCDFGGLVIFSVFFLLYGLAAWFCVGGVSEFALRCIVYVV